MENSLWVRRGYTAIYYDAEVLVLMFNYTIVLYWLQFNNPIFFISKILSLQMVCCAVINAALSFRI